MPRLFTRIVTRNSRPQMLDIPLCDFVPSVGSLVSHRANTAFACLEGYGRGLFGGQYHFRIGIDRQTWPDIILFFDTETARRGADGVSAGGCDQANGAYDAVGEKQAAAQQAAQAKKYRNGHEHQGFR